MNILIQKIEELCILNNINITLSLDILQETPQQEWWNSTYIKKSKDLFYRKEEMPLKRKEEIKKEKRKIKFVKIEQRKEKELLYGNVGDIMENEVEGVSNKDSDITGINTNDSDITGVITNANKQQGAIIFITPLNYNTFYISKGRSIIFNSFILNIFQSKKINENIKYFKKKNLNILWFSYDCVIYNDYKEVKYFKGMENLKEYLFIKSVIIRK